MKKSSMMSALFFAGFLFAISHSLYAIVIGSNTTPSRQALITFPAVDSDNEMRGFAAFENGFSLEDATTTCLYNSFFPISGTVTYNGGTVNLNRNISFANATTFADGGTIDGNGYKVAFPEKVSTFSLPAAMIFKDLELILHSDVVLSGLVTFQNACTIEGNGHTIDCSGGSIKIDTTANVLIKNSTLSGITEGKIYCNSSSTVLALQNVTWIQDGSYSFTQGKMEIYNQTSMTGGTFGFSYESDQISTIKSDATWLFDSGMTFSYIPSSANNLITFVDKTAALHLYETTLYVSTVGFELTKGTVVVEGTCPIDSQATVAAEGVQLGDGTASNDINLKVYPESGFRVDSGYLVNKIVNS